MPCTLFSLLMLILFASISYYARSCGFEDLFTILCYFLLVLSQTAIQSQPNEKPFGWKNTFFVRTSQRRVPPKGRTNTWKRDAHVPPQPLSTLFDDASLSKAACQNDAQTPPHACAPFTFLRMSCPPTGQKETENTRWLTSSFSTDAQESRIFKSPRPRGRTKDSRKA